MMTMVAVVSLEDKKISQAVENDGKDRVRTVVTQRQQIRSGSQRIRHKYVSLIVNKAVVVDGKTDDDDKKGRIGTGGRQRKMDERFVMRKVQVPPTIKTMDERWEQWKEQ